MKGGRGHSNVFIDSFSVGIDELSRKDASNELLVLGIISKAGRFSCFEASDNPTIAATMTRLMHGPLVEKYLPESYKGQMEPGGDARAPDSDTYPWTYVRLTPAGRAALSDLPPDEKR